MGTTPEVSEVVEAAPIKQSVKNINLGSREPISVNDKNKFDQLMSTYLKNPKNLQALNKLIDADKSILSDVFRKQFITNFDDYVGDLNKFVTDMKYDYNTFYIFLKDLLIQKNQFLLVTNTVNSEQNLGISPSDIPKQFGAMDKIQKKINQYTNHYNLIV